MGREDGSRVVFVTYGNGYEILRDAGEGWADTIQKTPRSFTLPLRRQGETICYSIDGTTLYLTSETSPCPLFAIRQHGVQTPPNDIRP